MPYHENARTDYNLGISLPYVTLPGIPALIIPGIAEHGADFVLVQLENALRLIVHPFLHPGIEDIVANQRAIVKICRIAVAEADGLYIFQRKRLDVAIGVVRKLHLNIAGVHSGYPGLKSFSLNRGDNLLLSKKRKRPSYIQRGT